MPIHEKSLIREEDLETHENMVIDGVDVSGHWSTFIKTRVVSDYNETLEEEIAALPGGEYVHRCWQCGSCTNACTVNEVNPDFNPRYWIYLIRMGMESELLRDKDIIWQCVSCNKCTYACPRDVFPEGVMKATAHWLERKGHTPKSPSASPSATTRQVAPSFNKMTEYIIRCWTFNVRCSTFISFFLSIRPAVFLPAAGLNPEPLNPEP